MSEIGTNKDELKRDGKRTGVFYFKQFKVEDGKSTMKVGTDAVLLGALAEVGNAERILEIGTGSGVIALIMAQRSKAKIDALEIDVESALQARENVKSSPWHNRISIIQESLQHFAGSCQDKYDVIISNPPYFVNSLKSPEKKRNISRHDESLSFSDLIENTMRLMTQGAGVWIILPGPESQSFSNLARSAGLFLHSRIAISSKEGKPVTRYILHFQKEKTESTSEKQIRILNADCGHSDDYKEITKEYYLDF